MNDGKRRRIGQRRRGEECGDGLGRGELNYRKVDYGKGEEGLAWGLEEVLGSLGKRSCKRRYLGRQADRVTRYQC